MSIDLGTITPTVALLQDSAIALYADLIKGEWPS